MANRITAWAADALVTYGAVKNGESPQILKENSFKDMADIICKINETMAGNVKKENLRKLHIHREGDGWALYRYPEYPDSGEEYRFI